MCRKNPCPLSDVIADYLTAILTVSQIQTSRGGRVIRTRVVSVKDITEKKTHSQTVFASSFEESITKSRTIIQHKVGAFRKPSLRTATWGTAAGRTVYTLDICET